MDLDCSAAGAPQPNYTWTIPPGSSGGQGSIAIGPVLRIPFSDTRDMGTYRCNASNEFGAVQRTFVVTVFGEWIPQGKLPGNTGLDGHRHRQNYSVIAPYACRFESVVGTLEDGLMHSFFAIVA